ncbi:MAG: leucine-rich repeat domain-containing protein [Candidatus Thorarchaeota archaeon]
MAEIFVWYKMSTGQEQRIGINANETCINLDLRDIVDVDLLPLIWCANLEDLSLRDNKLNAVILTPLAKCKNLRSLRLGNNRLESIDLTPLADCPRLEELSICGNSLRRVDISPLFQCQELKELKHDESVTLVADLTLKSVGSWPDVLVERFHRILWKMPDSE